MKQWRAARRRKAVGMCRALRRGGMHVRARSADSTCAHPSAHHVMQLRVLRSAGCRCSRARQRARWGRVSSGHGGSPCATARGAASCGVRRSQPGCRHVGRGAGSGRRGAGGGPRDPSGEAARIRAMGACGSGRGTPASGCGARSSSFRSGDGLAGPLRQQTAPSRPTDAGVWSDAALRPHPTRCVGVP